MKTYKCILVEGTEDAVVDIIEKEGQLDEDNNVVPELLIDYEDKTFLLSRTLIPTVFVYKLVNFLKGE